MLVALQIRDIILIDSLDLVFGPGLSVLTGETGAGKSIILDALGLALGTRAERSLVRAGAKSGSVTAVFRVPGSHPAVDLLRDSGLDPDGDELILRRSLGEDGRARGFVNDEPVSLNLLRSLGETLVEIHGQHDDRGLLDPVSHRALLDAFGGLEEMAKAVGAAFGRWRDARTALEAHEEEMAAAARDLDYVTHAVDELDALAPQAGEETALAGERAVLAHSVKVAEALGEAQDMLARDGGAAGRLAQAMRRLERVADKAGGRLAPALAAFERALAEAGEAEAELEAVVGQLGQDPRRLEQVEDRLFALRAAARKYNVHPDALDSLRASLGARLAAMEGSVLSADALRRTVEAARADFEGAARSLGEKRQVAARKLDAAVKRELKPLKLDKAVFETEIAALDIAEWGAGGGERVRFLVSTNPGTPLGPLTRIASGGELARFILALKVVLAREGSAATLIFDEVDQGIGGAVAAAVGDRLARLAGSQQVLVVTHSPQIAARADRHLRISKAAVRRGEGLVTRIEDLSDDARREEIARMLSGAEITNEARAAAEQLIAAGMAR